MGPGGGDQLTCAWRGRSGRWLRARQRRCAADGCAVSASMATRTASCCRAYSSFLRESHAGYSVALMAQPTTFARSIEAHMTEPPKAYEQLARAVRTVVVAVVVHTLACLCGLCNRRCRFGWESTAVRRQSTWHRRPRIFRAVSQNRTSSTALPRACPSTYQYATSCTKLALVGRLVRPRY